MYPRYMRISEYLRTRVAQHHIELYVVIMLKIDYVELKI